MMNKAPRLMQLPMTITRPLGAMHRTIQTRVLSAPSSSGSSGSRRGLMTTTTNLSICMHRQPLISRIGQVRMFVKVGDKVPVNFTKDGKDPTVRDDKDYPDWVHTLADKLPTKNQLIQMIDDAGGADADLTVLGEDNLRRAKRLINLDEIKKSNLFASTSKV